MYGQYAAKEANEKENQQFKLVQPWFEQQEGGPGEEGSEGSRGKWRQTAAKAAGDQVRRVREQKT